MFRIKRIHTYMLQTFLPLFCMTFAICLFIFIMQFLWRYVDELVGKGLSLGVLVELFAYASLTMLRRAIIMSGRPSALSVSYPSFTAMKRTFLCGKYCSM